MSRNFERVHKNCGILQEKMELSAGLGNYPKDSDVSPTSGMSRSEARYVLNLLNIGFEKVNFWMAISSSYNSLELTEGDLKLKMIAGYESFEYDMETNLNLAAAGIEIRKKDGKKIKYAYENHYYTRQFERTTDVGKAYYVRFNVTAL